MLTLLIVMGFGIGSLVLFLCYVGKDCWEELTGTSEHPVMMTPPQVVFIITSPKQFGPMARSGRGPDNFFYDNDPEPRPKKENAKNVTFKLPSDQSTQQSTQIGTPVTSVTASSSRSWFG